MQKRVRKKHDKKVVPKLEQIHFWDKFGLPKPPFFEVLYCHPVVEDFSFEQEKKINKLPKAKINWFDFIIIMLYI